MKELPAPKESKVYWVQVLNNVVPKQLRLFQNAAEWQEDRSTRGEKRP